MGRVMLVLMSSEQQDKLLKGLDIKSRRAYLSKSRRDGGMKLIQEIYEEHQINPKKADKQAMAAAAAEAAAANEAAAAAAAAAAAKAAEELAAEEARLAEEARIASASTMHSESISTMHSESVSEMTSDHHIMTTTYTTDTTEHVTEKLQKEMSAAEAADGEAQKLEDLRILVSTPKFEQRFNMLDVDKSGYLDHSEMQELARWIYMSLTKDNKVLDEAQVGIEAQKLIRKLDKNGDGKIGIEEFQEFFEKKAKQAAKFAAAMNKKGVDSVDLLNDEIVKKTVVISDAPAPVPEAPISSNASPSKADALQGMSEDEIVAQSMNMTVEEYRVAFGLPAGGAPAAPVEAPAVALTPEEEKAAKLAAEANKETDKMNKLTEFVSTPQFSEKFNELDLDNSGFLDAKEVKELCKWIHILFSSEGAEPKTDQEIEKEAKRLIRAIDKNGDGNIAMDEFRKHYETKAAKARKFAANQAKKNASPSK